MNETTRSALLFHPGISEPSAPVGPMTPSVHCTGVPILVPSPVLVTIQSKYGDRILLHSVDHGYVWASRLDLKPHPEHP